MEKKNHQNNQFSCCSLFKRPSWVLPCKPEPIPLGFISCVLYSKESKWWALKPCYRRKIHETETQWSFNTMSCNPACNLWQLF